MSTQLSLGIIAISSKCEFEMSPGDMGLMMTARVVGKWKLKISTYKILTLLKIYRLKDGVVLMQIVW